MARDCDSTKDRSRVHLNRILHALLAGMTLFIASCATVPPPILPPTNPASPQAEQAPEAPVQDSLGPDEATQETNNLIVGQEKGTPSPASGDHGDTPPIPGANTGGSK
jgi:hypothetical protein